MKIVCAFDSFKGCLTSREAGEAAAKGILGINGNTEVVIMECADGGEGTAAAIHAAGIGKWQTTVTSGPGGNRISGRWLFDSNEKIAIIDLAEASGLAKVTPSSPGSPLVQRPPMNTSTYGTGILIAEAIRMGATTICIGLGGSGTNDAGLGALSAMGAKFYDKSVQLLPPFICGNDLHKIDSIDTTSLRNNLRGVTLRLLCDVTNPFIGNEGAVATFARQKGANEEMRQLLEDGMRNIVRTLKRCGFTDISSLPGSGAAGGTAGGFVALTDAEIVNGAEEVLRITGFDKTLLHADLVITGEGSSDSQTLRGKLPMAVMTHAQKQGIPTLLASGRIENINELKKAGFTAVECINPSIKPSNHLPVNVTDPEIAKARIAVTVSSFISHNY